MTRDVGTSSGPVFVLVHGIGVSSRSFERVIPLLAERGRVIALDLPGFGRAREERWRGRVTVGHFSASVAAVLDGLGVAGAVVVGHSMGTQVATRLAIDRPDLVSAIVLLGPVMDPEDRRVLRAARLLGLDTLRESLRGDSVVFGDYIRCGPSWYLRVLPAMLGHRTERDAAELRMPAIVARGSRDPIAREPWVASLAGLSGGSAVSIAGSPHLVMHRAPNRTAELIASVLSDPRAEAAR